MPFRSKEQKTWLKHNRPDIYERWITEYGSRVKKSLKKKKVIKKRKTFKKDK